MALPAFPSFLRPLATYSYNLSGANLVRTQVAGGSSRATVNYCTEKVVFNVSFVIGDWEQMQIWNDWYFNIVEQGTRKFSMKLNASGTFDEHVCIIVPGSITVTGNQPFNISMQVEAEKIFAPFEGQLYLLSSEGYSNLAAYFARIEQFANYDQV